MKPAYRLTMGTSDARNSLEHETNVRHSNSGRLQRYYEFRRLIGSLYASNRHLVVHCPIRTDRRSSTISSG